jgi:hypothetical protein
MFGTLYEPPSLTFTGLFFLFAIQLCAIFVYKQAQSYYRNQQLYAQYGANLTKSVPPVTLPGPPGQATGAR